MAFPKIFKRETSQQRLTLDQSEWLVLKELASFFLSEDFPGSQLEALLRSRGMCCSRRFPAHTDYLTSKASLPVSNIDEITASILTPSPAVLITPSASGSEVEADAQTIQPPLVPSPADRTPSPTRQPTPSPQSVLEPEPESLSDGSESHSGPPVFTPPIVVDSSFEYCTIDGSASNVPIEVNNFSHCAEGIRVSKTSAFSHSKINNAVVNSHSFNGNVGSSIIRVRGPMNNVYRY